MSGLTLAAVPEAGNWAREYIGASNPDWIILATKDASQVHPKQVMGGVREEGVRVDRV